MAPIYLGSSYNSGRSTERFFIDNAESSKPIYHVVYSGDGTAFTVAYFDRYTMDMDESTFLAGGDFCQTF